MFPINGGEFFLTTRSIGNEPINYGIANVTVSGTEMWPYGNNDTEAYILVIDPVGDAKFERFLAVYLQKINIDEDDIDTQNEYTIITVDPNEPDKFPNKVIRFKLSKLPNAPNGRRFSTAINSKASVARSRHGGSRRRKKTNRKSKKREKSSLKK
jgi:hypothetical protein